eukprot:9304986-Prorocentrum_lima.AAC.1
MTSSLVGSEMCIRDSNLRLHTVLPCNIGLTHKQSSRPIKLKKRVITTTAVSYTHLTLPTICSV